jgi:hypothetical protein
MLASGTLDKMVNLHPAPHVALGPPAHGTRPMLGGELLERDPVLLGHLVQTIPFLISTLLSALNRWSWLSVFID